MFSKNKKPKQEARGHESDREDDLGPYPSDIDGNPTSQKITERALRMTTFGLGVSAVSNVALVALLIGILPLKQVYPYLVTFKDGDNQVVAVEPISDGAPGIQYATEASVRQYVKLRHTFEPVNTFMDNLWGANSQLAAMTGSTEYSNFKSTAEIEREQMLQRGLSRKIEIETATMIRPDTWQVAFTTVESVQARAGVALSNSFAVVPGGNPLNQQDVATPMEAQPAAVGAVTRKWLATMTINYEPQRIEYDKRLLNPLGFTVTDYSVIERN